MHDIRFPELSKIKDTPPAIGLGESCARSWQAFQTNRDLARNIALLPGVMFFLASKWGEAGTHAKVELIGWDEFMFEGHPRSNEIGELAQKKMGVALGSFTGLSSPDTEKCAIMLDFILKEYKNPIAYEALYGALKSVVVNVWAAFESFFGQLVKNAVKDHPKSFAHVTKEPSAKTRETFLKSYQRAFQNDTSIVDLTESDCVRVLGEIRHVLTHSLGKTDPPFLGARDGRMFNTTFITGSPILQNRFPVVAMGDDIELDGLFLCKLIDEATEVCFALVFAVDKWIAANV